MYICVVVAPLLRYSCLREWITSTGIAFCVGLCVLGSEYIFGEKIFFSYVSSSTGSEAEVVILCKISKMTWGDKDELLYHQFAMQFLIRGGEHGCFSCLFPFSISCVFLFFGFSCNKSRVCWFTGWFWFLEEERMRISLKRGKSGCPSLENFFLQSEFWCARVPFMQKSIPLMITFPSIYTFVSNSIYIGGIDDDKVKFVGFHLRKKYIVEKNFSGK